jgi:elongation factor P
MVTASKLRAGMAIRHEGQVYKVIAADYHGGQGKMGGVAHVRLKNLATGTFTEQGFRADLRFEDLAVEKQSLDFLYSDAEQCHFMNPDTFEQVSLPAEVVGPQARFLLPEMRVPVEFVEGQPLGVLFPDFVEIRVDDTAPATHQQQDSTLKSARLDNGVEVMVPQFIKAGDVIRVDLGSLKYVERAKTSGR